MGNLNISDEALKKLRYDDIKLYYETIFNSKMFADYSMEHVHIEAKNLKNVASMHNGVDATDFLNLNEEAQINYLTNTCPLNIVQYLENEEILSKYKDIIFKRIIDNQDLIFYYAQNYATSFIISLDLSRLIATNIILNKLYLSKITDDNLVTLLYLIDKDFEHKEVLLDEVKSRIDNGKVLFDKHNITVPLIFFEVNESLTAFSKLPVEYQDKVKSLGIENWKEVPEDIRHIKWDSSGLFQQLSVAKQYANGYLGENGLRIIRDLIKVNPNFVFDINYELLNEDIINILGIEFVKKVCSFNKESFKLVSMYQNDRELFESYARIVNEYFRNDTLKTGYEVSIGLLDFFFDNSEYLKTIDLTALNTMDFINYVMLNQKFDSKTVDYTKNYSEDFISKCDDEFEAKYNSSFYKDDIKKIFVKKYFSITYNEAKELVKEFSAELGLLKEFDDTGKLCEVIRILDKLINENDKKTIKDMYYNNNIFINSTEMISINNKLRQYISSKYVSKIDQTDKLMQARIRQDKIRKVPVNGKEVQIIPIDDNFSFIVYSSNTSYKGDKELVNNSYIDSWYQIDNAKTHGIATSYISNINTGTAPVCGNGVLYAFTNLEASKIIGMGPHDINSHISDYGGKSGEQNRYLSPDNMSLDSVRLYNEFMLERDSIKPNYIIIFTGATEENIKSALAAAAEWDIPIVEINKTKLAKKQMKNVTKLVNDFKDNKNFNSLEQAIRLFEAHTSGFKLNHIPDSAPDDLTRSINHESLRHIFDTSIIKTAIKEVALTSNQEELEQIKNILNEILAKYEYANDMFNKHLPKTESTLNINELIEYIDTLINQNSLNTIPEDDNVKTV